MDPKALPAAVPQTAIQAARKLRAQDLEAACAMRACKAETLRAAQAIKDCGQLYPADMLVLAHTLQLQIERYQLWLVGQEVGELLDCMQEECSRGVREWAAADARAAA